MPFQQKTESPKTRSQDPDEVTYQCAKKRTWVDDEKQYRLNAIGHTDMMPPMFSRIAKF